MTTPNPLAKTKGAGTTFWMYTGNGDAFANPLSDTDWLRLAMVKDLQPGEMTADAEDDTYLDDEDADWKTTTQGQKSVGDTSATLAWRPGDSGQKKLVQLFDSGEVCAFRIKYPNGTVDVFRGWLSSLGKTIASKDVIAMSALAEETGRRTADIDNNLNALGSTLKYLSDLWSRFWDAAMNIGREDSLDEQIAALQEKVSRAKRLPWTASSSQVEYDQQRLNDLQEKKRQKDLQDAKEQAERNYQEQQKRRNAENAALNRMNETEAARHQREIARINAMQYADQAVRDAAIQRENERYEKALASGKKKTRETRNDEATRVLLQYSQQQAQVEGQIAAARQSAGIATERMTEAHKQLLALQQRISDLDGKKLTADEKSVLARKDELIQALTLLDVKQQELQKQTALNELKKKTIQLTSQLAEEERAQRQQHDLDIATVGMGDQQRQRYQVQLSLRQKYQQQLEQLRRDSEQKGTYNTDDYRKAEQALTESLNRQLNENRRYWQQLEVVQGNWKNGVLRAFQDFTVDADNTAETAEQVFSSAFSNMGNGLATFVTTGKLNFKSFTSSVLSDMAKILAQATMMKSIKGIGSVLGFDLSSLSLNANGGFISLLI